MGLNQENVTASAMYPGFKNYAQFLTRLQRAIDGQAGAIRFYMSLQDLAKEPWQKAELERIRKDEQRHYRMLVGVYQRLTGNEPTVNPASEIAQNYKEGIKRAIVDEIEAAALYQKMYLTTQIRRLRDLLFRIMTDETKHAQKLQYIFSQL